ncbi:MAG: NAD(P)H-hydrate dehydratase [Leptospirillia bacterium]
MRIVTPEEMRELDGRATREFSLPEEILMERAGMAVAASCREILGPPEKISRKIVAVVGGGHNGGDALVALRDLAARGYPAAVVRMGSGKAPSEAISRELDRLSRMGVGPSQVGDSSSRHRISHAALLIDGLFGTGFRGGDLSREARELIVTMNRAAGSGIPIVCVDIPSGVNGTTGAVSDVAVRGKRTVTFGAPKWGLLCDPGTRYAGHIYLSPIGFPQNLLAGGKLSCLLPHEAWDLVPVRSPSVHKGEAGHVLIAGGSPGKSGSILLAARGALRSGAGLVTVLWDRSFGEAAASQAEIMSLPVDLATLSSQEIIRATVRMDAVACGPGVDEAFGGRLLVESLFSEYTGPLVGDAGVFDLFAGQPEKIASLRPGPLVLTPHPGEMGRLLGRETAHVVANPLDSVREAAERTGAVILLKGARTHVAHPDGRVSLNLTGNPVMAGAGMGDVLTGVIATFLAQGLSPFDAARLGAFLHGQAGELLGVTSTRGRLASELADLFPVLLSPGAGTVHHPPGLNQSQDPALFWPFPLPCPLSDPSGGRR